MFFEASASVFYDTIQFRALALDPMQCGGILIPVASEASLVLALARSDASTPLTFDYD